LTTKLKVGDLVRDNLNEGTGNYGLGVVVAVDTDVPAAASGRRYDVYFSKFGSTITFHEAYLEKV